MAGWLDKTLGVIFGTAVTGAAMSGAMANPDISQAPQPDLDSGAITEMLAGADANIFPDLKNAPSADGYLPMSPLQVMDVSGLYALCESNPGTCVPPIDGFTTYLVPSEKLLSDINEINERVNTAPYIDRNDGSWNPIDSEGGVCRNYAFTKKLDMIEARYPPEALNMIFVTTPEGLPHAVLGVATTQGILMMDSAGPLAMLHTSDYTLIGMTEADDPWKAYEPATIVEDPLTVDLAEQELARNTTLDDSAYAEPNPLDQFLGRNADVAASAGYNSQDLDSLVNALAEEVEHPDVLINLPSYMSEDPAPEEPKKIAPIPLMRPPGL